MTSATTVEAEQGIEATARGAAVHELLEWSQAHGWAEPDIELSARHARAAGLELEGDQLERLLLDPVRAWLAAPLLRDRIAVEGTSARAEVSLLLDLSGTLLRGSIDLLVERAGSPPLLVDYKTDRLDGSSTEERAAHYGVQRDIYALAVAEARDAAEVEVAYVFLERPDEPVLALLDREQIEAGRARVAAAVERIAATGRSALA